jgi:threonine aldolase
VSQIQHDFRSDTVTRPCAAMRDAIAKAEVGDDVLDGDPTVGALEALAAEWLGKEGALFVPSGTMANQVALGVWTRPGDEIVVEQASHVVNFEAGAAGYLHGVQSRTLEGNRGALGAADVQAAIQPDSLHCPRTTLVCVEQTHMSSGGRVVPLDALRAVHRTAYAAKIPVHMDGARLANAVVASGTSAREWAACADSVSICLSKGLGAPVGSLIAGGDEFIEKARVVRKRLGGWMRQSGFLAAAGVYALQNNVERLKDDHALAQDLAARLNEFDAFQCPPEEVETNLVLVRVESTDFDAASLSAKLAEEGVGVLPLGPNTLRFVTHLDVAPADLDHLQQTLQAILA